MVFETYSNYFNTGIIKQAGGSNEDCEKNHNLRVYISDSQVFFEFVDAKSGFHLLQVKEEHINFTAFSFKGKLYQFHRAPFDGFKPVLDKVEAINNLPIPTTVTEIRSFLGSCNYLRRFISNYSELTARLTALTAKSDFTKSFDVYIDASDIGSCCVIMQDDGNGNIRPILYESCRFNKFQRNSSTTDREF
ncbi:hypothetical protein ACTFIT_009770 [Dictyostelium discoideum]